MDSNLEFIVLQSSIWESKNGIPITQKPNSKINISYRCFLLFVLVSNPLLFSIYIKNSNSIKNGTMIFPTGYDAIAILNINPLKKVSILL